MPKYQLQAWFDAENIYKVEVEDLNSYEWKLKASCSNCKSETPKFLFITSSEEVGQGGSRGTANCVYKCTFCKREISISVLNDTYKDVNVKPGEIYAPLISFDIRGAEPSQWQPSEIGLIAYSRDMSADQVDDDDDESGSKFDVDFSEGEWADYDETLNIQVGIYNVKSKFHKIK